MKHKYCALSNGMKFRKKYNSISLDLLQKVIDCPLSISLADDDGNPL